ncbi:MAG: LysM peptidoglycan-binding domain-containing protein [bacterium]|nr:LysM peptidoglycan-binding domain-containing protein [bacterium]
MKRMLFALLSVWVLVGALLSAAPTAAQSANVLNDPGFEGEYTNRGRSDLNTPAAWSLTVIESPRTQDWMNLVPVGFPHNGPGPDPHGGARAQNFNRGYATFTVALYQTVAATSGSNVTASAWAQIKTCNVPANADNCASSSESGAYTRVGIDPNGGTNVYDSDIVWSANAAPHDTWLQMTTTATATGSAVTIFLFGTQNLPTQLNKLYWDDAYLGGGGVGGAAAAPGVPAAPPPTPVPAFVPFVVPQNQRADGSIVHIVGPGDTMDSIAFAYGMTRDEVLALNPNIRDARYILQGQEVIIQAATSAVGGVGNEPAASGETGLAAPEGFAPPNSGGVPPSGGGIADIMSGGAAPSGAEQSPVQPQVEPPAPPRQSILPTIPNAPIGVVGGSAGLSGYFPPRVVRNTASAPPGAGLTAFRNVRLTARSTATEYTLTAAGNLPADVHLGKMRARPIHAKPAAQAPDSAAQTPGATDGGLRQPVEVPEAAPAPVTEVGGSVPARIDPAAPYATLCVSMFNDLNRNRIQETGESLLPGGVITLQVNAETVLTHTTDGESEPFCFEGLEPGAVTASATAPTDYGLTTPVRFVVRAVAGVNVPVEFGAGFGVAPVVVPPAESEPAAAAAGVILAPANPLADNLGLLLIGLAVLVLMGGAGLTMVFARRRW